MVVVGSGPAGAACAYHLLQRGHRVTMIDIGRKLEELPAALIDDTKGVDYLGLKKYIAQKRKSLPKAGLLPEKVPYGSNIIYQTSPQHSYQCTSTKFNTSEAFGGLSNTWGANLSLFADSDIQDWPIAYADLKPYYQKLQSIIGISAEADDVDLLYADPLQSQRSFPIGPQGAEILKNAKLNSQDLRATGLYVGASKLAVGKMYSRYGAGCVSCGLCMHGCPHNAIFNSAQLVQRLIQNNNFTYQPGYSLQTFAERDGKVYGTVECVERGNMLSFSCDRLFLAMGVIATTATVLRSLSWFESKIKIPDSQKYVFLYIKNRANKGVLAQQYNTLSQIFVQTKNLSSTSKIASAQLYGFNDLLLEPVKRFFGNLALKMAPLGAPLFNRLMIGFVYLHSDDSGHLEFEVYPAAQKRGYGRVTGFTSTQSDRVYREFIEKIYGARKLLGGRPLRFYHNKNLPGNDQHFGGSIPMQSSPRRFASDLLGRPYGCNRVHIADASVFPSIPGVSTTYSIMANAMRIAHLS